MSNQPGKAVATRAGRGVDDLSVVGFVHRHTTMKDLSEALLQEAQAMAAAADGMPVAAVVKQNLSAFAAMVRAVAGVAEGLYPAARKAQADDFERAENPRGGTRAVEQKADVRAAGADGY